MRFSPLRMPYGELNCLDKNLVFVFALVAARAVLAEEPDVLSLAERQLLGEWLDQMAGGG